MTQAPTRQRPGGPQATEPSRAANLVQRLAAAGFRLLELDQFDFQIMPPLARPHVLGVAQRPASRPSALRAKR
jgi:hypothetical protein